MKRILLALTLAVSLAGCATLSTVQQAFDVAANFTVSQNGLDATRASYDATALVALKAYAVMPRCAPGTTISTANRCHDKALLRRMRDADRQAAKAFAATQAQIDSGNATGAAAAWQALQTAIAAVKQIISDNGISL